jgi:pyridoxine kinase
MHPFALSLRSVHQNVLRQAQDERQYLLFRDNSNKHTMNPSPIPKLAAIHDLSCVGRAALTVVIPILSTMGIQVCPLPTAVFSTHGRFPGYHVIDLTDDLEAMIEHWHSFDMRFDGIYSGFLGAARQVDIISAFIRHFSKDNQLVVIDPVLGDHGTVYGVTDKKLVQAMRQYIELANVITPNITEAALLLDKPYREDLDQTTAKDWMQRLSDKGPEIVILTSVLAPSQPTHIATMAYHRGEKQFLNVTTEAIPAQFPGTGDAFTSVITGSLLQGDRLSVAVDRAVQFLVNAMAATITQRTPEREGIAFETVLSYLSGSSSNGCHRSAVS